MFDIFLGLGAAFVDRLRARGSSAEPAARRSGPVGKKPRAREQRQPEVYRSFSCRGLLAETIIVNTHVSPDVRQVVALLAKHGRDQHCSYRRFPRWPLGELAVARVASRLRRRLST